MMQGLIVSLMGPSGRVAMRHWCASLAAAAGSGGGGGHAREGSQAPTLAGHPPLKLVCSTELPGNAGVLYEAPSRHHRCCYHCRRCPAARLLLCTAHSPMPKLNVRHSTTPPYPAATPTIPCAFLSAPSNRKGASGGAATARQSRGSSSRISQNLCQNTLPNL